jgi:hypothetical protein
MPRLIPKRPRPVRPLLAIHLLVGATLLATSCANVSSVTMTASKTRAPVLLGRLERIGSGTAVDVAAVEATAAKGGKRWTVAQADSVNLLVLGGQSSQKKRTHRGHTDVELAKLAAGKGDASVWVDHIDVAHLGVYYVLGLYSKDSVTMNCSVSTPAQKRGQR